MLRDFGLVTLIDLSVSLVGVLVALPAAVVMAERSGERSPALADPPARPRQAGGESGRVGPWTRLSRPAARSIGALGSPASGAGPHQPAEPPRYGRYVVLLAIVILVFITVNTLVTKPNGASGVAPGEQLPPFAVPLATGTLKGDANVSTAGKAPACTRAGAGSPEHLPALRTGPRGARPVRGRRLLSRRTR